MKRLLTILLAAAMLLGISMTASAAGEDTGFTDVDAGAWYAEAVASWVNGLGLDITAG